MIALQALQKVVERTTVLDIAALTVADGEIAAVVGSAGSGIAELLELLIGRTRPTMGTVDVAGVNPAQDHEVFSRCAGVVFADDGLYKSLSPSGNLEFHARLYGISKERVAAVLAQVGLADQAGASLEKLPPGLLRRLAFGRAILHEPQALVLVEPFARCDEATITIVSTLMRQLADEGASVLILSADSTRLAALCDAIYVLDQGRITESRRPQEEGQPELPFKIPVRMEDKVVLFNPADILYAEAEEGRAYVVTASGRLPTQFTLAELEQRLARSGFFRAHRSFLVNLQHVKEVIPYTRNSFSLRLDDPENTTIPLSKSAAGELQALLGW